MGGGAIAAKNVDLGFLAPFFSWRFSDRVGFGERGVGFSGSSRSELVVPVEQSNLLGYIGTGSNLATSYWRGTPWGGRVRRWWSHAQWELQVKQH